MSKPLHLATCLVLLGSCLASSSTSWGKAAVPSTKTHEGEPRSIRAIRFRFHADGPIRGGFAWSDGRLFFGTEAGSFYALSAPGKLLWQTPVGAGIASTPAVDKGTVYFTAWDNALHAVDKRSGRPLWLTRFGPSTSSNRYWDYYSSSPVLENRTIYVGAADGYVYAIDAASHHIRWKTSVGAVVRTTPALANDRVVVGTSAGRLFALGKTDGRLLWSFATVGAGHDFALQDNDTRSIVTPPIIARDLVIAGGRDGNVYAVGLSDGKEHWHETHDGSSWILGLASDGTRVYSGSGSALIIQATNLQTGKEIWRAPTGNPMFGGLALKGDAIVANAMKGYLAGFEAASGKELWHFPLSDMTFSSPLVAAGMIFTGSDDGNVVALTGSEDPATPIQRYVFSYSDQPDAGFFWFPRQVVQALDGAFAEVGYKKIGNGELAVLLSRPDPSGSVVVLADTRLPATVTGDELHKFVERGGKIVLIGPNPLAFAFDPKTGEPTTQDDEKAAAAFGLKPGPRERDNGWNVSTYSRDAQPLGLNGYFVSEGAVPVDNVDVILGKDQSGLATAWVKRFPRDGLLINLPAKRYAAGDLARFVEAVQLAVSAPLEQSAVPAEAVRNHGD